jgi:hypothetical protein
VGWLLPPGKPVFIKNNSLKMLEKKSRRERRGDYWRKITKETDARKSSG